MKSDIFSNRVLPIISPSLLCSDFYSLRDTVEMINRSDADWLHCDVMDGLFTPNITFGFAILDAIKEKVNKPLDVHLMIEKPERYIERFRDSNAQILTVHYEACIHLHRTISEIKKYKMYAGVAINPATPVSILIDIVDLCDLVTIMSVNPGFGGQAFIENTYDKVIKLKEIIQKKNSKCMIQIDGGVSKHNADKLLNCGADILVAGNSVFHSNDPEQEISILKNITGNK